MSSESFVLFSNGNLLSLYDPGILSDSINYKLFCTPWIGRPHDKVKHKFNIFKLIQFL